MNYSVFNIIRRIRQKVKEGLLLLPFLTLTFILIPETGFAQDHQNDWYYNPFNQNSAHHRPIGTGAIYADENHPAVQDWLTRSRLNINVGDRPHGLHTTYADEDGPVLTVNKRQETGTSGLPAVMRFPSGGVDIDFPDHFDGNMTVYDRTTDVWNHLRVYAWNDGNPVAMQYRSYEHNSIGHGEELAKRVGTSASGVAAPFGILRGWEVKKTGHPIGHAIQIVVPARQAPIMMAREVWWPAVGMDGFAYTTAEYNIGNIPYGSLWAIPPVSEGGPDLDTLGLTEKGRRLAQAFRDYGAYVVDDGNHPSIRCDQNFSESLRNELVEETRKFYPYIRMVLNSVPDEGKVVFNVGDRGWAPSGPVKQVIRGEFPAGGGTPLAPNTAIDAITSSFEETYGLENTKSIRVFPNPAKDNIITIELNAITGNAIAEVFNMLGRRVKSKQLKEPTTNLHLPDGHSMHIVRINTGTENKAFKIISQKR